MTVYDVSDFLSAESSSAAQRVTAVRSGRALRAFPSLRPEDPMRRILSAVVGRALDVDELQFGDRVPTHALLPSAQRRRSRGRRDGDGVLVLLLQAVAYLAKLRQRFPTGLDGAGTGNAVTTTLHVHHGSHRLRGRIESTGDQ